MSNLLLSDSLEQIITNTVNGVKQYIQAKEEIENYDQAYEDARKFISEYRHCLWYGKATDYFLEEFKQYTISLFKTQKIKKANNFLMTTLAGLATSFVGIYMQSRLVATAGTIACGLALIMGYLTARNIRNELDELKEAINNPEEINTALQSLYKQGK